MAGNDRTASDRVDRAAESQPRDAVGQVTNVPDDDRLRAIADEPYKFGFFEALRLLENVFAESPRIGQAKRARDEPVRIGQQPTLAFPPAAICSFGKRGDRHHLLTWYFGLFGSNGPLPLHLTEFAYERSHSSRDETIARFFDLFHHRIASLFYRAWASAQPTVSADRPDEDRFADFVGSLLGIGMPSLHNRDAMPDRAKLFFAGHLSSQTRHPDGLRSMLAGFLQTPVRIDEFVGHWINLPDDCRFVLGESRSTSELGVTTTIGSRVWDRQHKFRVELGSLTLARFRELLPGGASLTRLVAVVRNYLGDEFLWDVRLILKREEVPQFELGRSAKLGWTMWLTSRQPEQDSRDLVISPLE